MEEEKLIKAILYIDYDRCGNISKKEIEKYNKHILENWEAFYGFSSRKYVPVLYINSDDDRDVYNWRRGNAWPELGIDSGFNVPAGFPLCLLKGRKNGDTIKITVKGDKRLLLTIVKNKK